MAKHFYELSPAAFELSLFLHRTGRSVKNLFQSPGFAAHRQEDFLPYPAVEHDSPLYRNLTEQDQILQDNKIRNLQLACEQLNTLIIRPGETFSFWHTLKKPTLQAGYREGLMIAGSRMSTGIGGGLCQAANMIHYLVLHSPLEVKELHHHSDALFPDQQRRVPFGIGTSVAWNHIDYRFYNGTDQSFQLIMEMETAVLHGELRCSAELPWTYRLREENHHYRQEDKTWYRISRVYRDQIDKASGTIMETRLILNNHSRVMFDPALIPDDEKR